MLPILSENEAETESNKYKDIEHNTKAEAFSCYNANAKRWAINDDITNGITKALPAAHIVEKTGRSKKTVYRALYLEDKYNNKPTLESLGLINYYATDIGSRQPQRMFYRKQKCSNSFKSIEDMGQKKKCPRC